MYIRDKLNYTLAYTLLNEMEYHHHSIHHELKFTLTRARFTEK